LIYARICHIENFAEMDDADRCAQEGDFHLHEVRIDGDRKLALELYRQSADQGNAHSQTQLGRMYFHGVGVDRDYQAALEWFRKSAEQGNGEGQACLGHMLEKGLGIDPDVRAAFELYRKSAKQGNTLGQIRVGDIYLNGVGVDPNPRKALAWYQKAAEQGHDPENAGLAQLRLGAAYCQGRGVEKDLKKGFEFYTKSAKLGNVEAQLCLGAMYRDGVGVERDHKKAAEWFQKSAPKSNVPTARALGDLYRDGLIVEKNIPEAMAWYEKAAENGDKSAKTELLKLQQQGIPQPKFNADTETAGQGFKKDVENESMPLHGKLKPIHEPATAKLKIEKKIAEKTISIAVPSRNEKIEKTPAFRIRLILFSAIVLVGLALAAVFFNSFKKSGKSPVHFEPGIAGMTLPHPPAPRLILPGIPELPLVALDLVAAPKSPRKLKEKSPPPIVTANPVEVKSEPVAPLLRRKYKSLAEGEISEMLAAKNIFDAARNPGGKFQHQYEIKNAGGLSLIFDRATNLTWARQQNLVKMNLEKTITWIESLNRVEFGGSRYWRLPTIEEAAALLEKTPDVEKTFLAAFFGKGLNVIWTGDLFTESESWAVDFQDGTVKQAKNKSRLLILMVSSDPNSVSQ
jgi:TPR repeat protein